MSIDGNKPEYKPTMAVGGTFDANRDEQESRGSWSFCYAENTDQVLLKVSTGELRLSGNRRELEAKLNREAVEQLTTWLLQVTQRLQHNP